MDWYGVEIWGRTTANVVAGLTLATCVVLLYAAYKMGLRRLAGAKMKELNTNYAKVHSLASYEVKGNINFHVELLQEENVVFQIVDKDDNVIKLLVDEKMNPGNYPISWDSTTLPDGVYFYQMITDLQKITKVFRVKNLVKQDA